MLKQKKGSALLQEPSTPEVSSEGSRGRSEIGSHADDLTLPTHEPTPCNS